MTFGRSNSASRRKDPSGKESGEETKSIEEDMKLTENDEVEKAKMTKTDPLSIKKGKRETLKKDRRQDPHLVCGDDCKFKAKGKERRRARYRYKLLARHPSPGPSRHESTRPISIDKRR